MGCWNGTCGFSQQSILHGDKVVAFIILNNEIPYSSCYSTGISYPMSFPIHAEYNDYGSIENVEESFGSKSTLLLFNHYLKHDKIVFSEGFYDDISRRKNSHGVGYNDTDGFEDIDTLFYCIERGHLQLKSQELGGYKEVNRGIDFILIKRDVLLSAWETVEFNTDWGREKTTFENIKADIQILIDDVINPQEIETEETIMRKMEALDIDKDKEELRILTKKLIHLDKFYPWGGDNLKSHMGTFRNACVLLTSYNSVHTDSFRILFNIIKETYDGSMCDNLKESISQFLMTYASFDLFRKSWAPQGVSSQNDNFDATIDYTERLLRRMYVVRRQRNKDGYYEDGLSEIVGQLSIFDEGKIL